VTLGFDRRVALVEWAARRGGWIVEDDYDGEFRYEGAPLTPFFSLDSPGRTIYIGTLNKSMSVSLGSHSPSRRPRSSSRSGSCGRSSTASRPQVARTAIDLFMDERHFSSHLRRMRGVYREAIGADRRACADGVAGLDVAVESGRHAPAAEPSRRRYFRAIAPQSGLDLALASAYRQVRRDGNGLFLRFGALDRHAIADGAPTLVCAGHSARHQA
jgi:GntR family transcriptional regulator/MocR family aminotransferase